MLLILSRTCCGFGSLRRSAAPSVRYRLQTLRTTKMDFLSTEVASNATDVVNTKEVVEEETATAMGSSGTERERIFVGIKLPLGAVTSLCDAYGGHQDALSGVKWEKQENLHITLRFIGDLTPEKRLELQEGLHQLSASESPIDTSLLRYSMFPKKGDFRILHCDVAEDSSQSFGRLQARVDDCITSCGIEFRREDREFHPHVTLARNRRSNRKAVRAWIESLGEFNKIDFTVLNFQLFRSMLSKDGATYVELASYPLSSFSSERAEETV